MTSGTGNIFQWNKLERIIHHNDCTWCRHRLVYYKAIHNKNELERCALTGKTIVAPKDGRRYCQNYQQKGCPCMACNLHIPNGIYT